MVDQVEWGEPIARDAYSLVLEAIHEHWRIYKCSPSYRWLGRHIVPPGEKPRSNAVVNHAINRLVRDGLIIKEPGPESSYPAVIPVEVTEIIGNMYDLSQITIPSHAPSPYQVPGAKKPVTERRVRMWLRDNMPTFSTYKTARGRVGIVDQSDPLSGTEANGWRELAIKIGMPC